MRHVIAAAVLAGLVAAACGGATVGEATVTLRDGDLDPGASSFTAGQVNLDIVNYGALPHTLVVTTADGEVVAATDLVVPGGSVDLDVDLGPGRYQFSCRIVAQGDDGAVFDHYEQGMVADVTVAG